ncbi:MAG: hypothetical protein ABI741_14315 [Ferruginibacter sp.]
MRIASTKWQYRALALSTFFLFSCIKYHEQYYNSFDEFNVANVRNKSWFPYKIISADTYELKNISSLDHNFAFGSFKYLDDRYYDSIFNSDKTERISFKAFNAKVKLNKAGKPSWFIDTDATSINDSDNIKYERFYITRNKNKKVIYFVLSR